MKLKGRFKQSSVVIQFLIFFFITIAGSTLVSITNNFILNIEFGAESSIMTRKIMRHMTKYPEWIKNIQFLQTIGVFIFPSMVCAWLFSDNYKRYLRIDTSFQLPISYLVVLSILVGTPFLNGIYILNQQIIFPRCLNGLEEWIKNYEKFTQNVIDSMLYVYHWQDLVSNILITCVFASIGEEFIFRGVLQNLLSRFIKSPYVVIWIVAILFSITHLQFYGFLPRTLIGVYLGYLLYYTDNIWIPILAHFTNNFLVIINSYIFQDNSEMAEKINSIGSGTTWWISIVSLVLFLMLFYTIKNRAYLNYPNRFD